jgi:hypothetical protein
MKPWVLAVMRPLMKRAKLEQFRSFILPLARMLVEGRRDGRDLLFYDAPVVLLFHRSAYTEDGDAMIACTYAMLAATALGLGNTMIGSAAPLLARNPALSEKWGVPKGNQTVVALIVGHPAISFEPRPTSGRQANVA